MGRIAEVEQMYKSYFERYRKQQIEDILTLIDIALWMKDKEWFLELTKRLERVK